MLDIQNEVCCFVLMLSANGLVVAKKSRWDLILC